MTTTPFDKEPPHSLLAEMALLGALILSEPSVPEVCAILPGSEAFYLPKHGIIYRAIVESADKGQGGYLALVSEALSARGMLAEIGGLAYLEKLATETPGPATAAHFARIVAEKHRLRMLLSAAARLAESCTENTHLTSGEIAAKAADDLAKATMDIDSGTVKLGDASAQVVQALCENKPGYIPTPWPEFDKDFGGIPSGCVSTFMGTPSSGKTTLCLQLLRHVAGLGMPVVVFSNEQGPRRVAATLLSMETGIPVHDRWGRGNATVAELRIIQAASERLAKLPFEQVSCSMNAQQIVQQAKFAKQRGAKVVFVDYLQQIPALPGCNSDRERIAESMKMLCRIRDLDMTLLLVSQIDKSTSKGTAISGDSKRRPTMFDGLGAAEIEQGSDYMYSVFRPHQHEQPGDDIDGWKYQQSLTEFAVLKSKYGAKGVHNLRFDTMRMEFVQ